MTLPKKGTRRITVEGVDYRYLVSPGDEIGIGIIVEPLNGLGQEIITWIEHGIIISSKLVRQSILSALAKGWNPGNQRQKIEFRFEDIINRTDDSEPLLVLRYYQKEDYKAVLHLHKLALRQGSEDREQEKLNNDLYQIYSNCQGDRDKFIVGCLNNQIVSIGSFKGVSDNEAQIVRMQVHPDFQRRGCGQQMLESLEASAITLGYKTLSLYATSIQIAAQNLYIKNGYIENNRKPWRGMERIYFEKQVLSNF